MTPGVGDAGGLAAAESESVPAWKADPRPACALDWRIRKSGGRSGCADNREDHCAPPCCSVFIYCKLNSPQAKRTTIWCLRAKRTGRKLGPIWVYLKLAFLPFFLPESRRVGQEHLRAVSREAGSGAAGCGGTGKTVPPGCLPPACCGLGLGEGLGSTKCLVVPG